MPSAKNDTNTGCLIILIILVLTGLLSLAYNIWLHRLFNGL